MQTAAGLLYGRALEIAEPGMRIGMLGAVVDSRLAELSGTADLKLQQSFRPERNALAALGLESGLELAGEFDLMLLLPDKQRTKSLARMAESMQRLLPGGRLLFCCPNDLGAKTYEARLKALAGGALSESKSKCRIVTAVRSERFDAEMAAAWRRAAAPIVVKALGLNSRPGLFSWDRPDPGSLLLLEQLQAQEAKLEGNGMDLCCGNGFLATRLLDAGVIGNDALHLVDAEAEALECARSNLKKYGAKAEFHWLDAANELLPPGLGWIVLNPPFHTGKARDVGLGERIVAAACKSLKPSGSLWLVANRQLPYERVLRKHVNTYEELAAGHGFKVIRGIR